MRVGGGAHEFQHLWRKRKRRRRRRKRRRTRRRRSRRKRRYKVLEGSYSA